MDEKMQPVRVPNFMLIAHDDGEFLLNLEQIRVIDEIRQDHCRVMFSEGFRINLNGSGANDLLAYLMAQSTIVNGERLVDVISKEDRPKS